MSFTCIISRRCLIFLGIEGVVIFKICLFSTSSFNCLLHRRILQNKNNSNFIFLFKFQDINNEWVIRIDYKLYRITPSQFETKLEFQRIKNCFSLVPMKLTANGFSSKADIFIPGLWFRTDDMSHLNNDQYGCMKFKVVSTLVALFTFKLILLRQIQHKYVISLCRVLN